MTPVVFVTIALALFGVSFAVYNHIFQPLRLPTRVLVGGAALVVLFVPNSAISIVGALCILTVFGLNYVESRETAIGLSLPGSS
jgi:hypothetical protein